jgi:Na+/glutamate symporter
MRRFILKGRSIFKVKLFFKPFNIPHQTIALQLKAFLCMCVRARVRVRVNVHACTGVHVALQVPERRALITAQLSTNLGSNEVMITGYAGGDKTTPKINKV